MTASPSFEREWRELVEAAAERGRSGADVLALPAERRVPFSRVALLAQLEEVREEWGQLRSRVDEEIAERFINAGWTLKDLLAHMASWAREFRSEIETVHAGESFDYAIPHAMGVFGPTAWNEEEVARRRDETLQAVLDEYDRETERLIELVLAMTDRTLYGEADFPLAPSGDPAARLRGPAAFVVYGKCVHDLHHLAQIKSRLPRLSR